MLERRLARDKPGATLKIISFASDQYALQPLMAMAESRHDLAGIVTKPERPSGRGLKISPTPVVEFASDMNIPLYKPEKLVIDEFLEFTSGLDWNVGVVVAYGDLIPGWLIELPNNGFVNLHPSLLPRYRGAAPVERALMNGASITGVTTIKMDERLDTGDILMHREEPIYQDDTSGTLKQRLAYLGTEVILKTLDGLESGEIQPVPQEEDKATLAPPIKAEDCAIDWRLPAENIERLVRALNPDPGAYTMFRGKRLKILAARLTDVPQENDPGVIESMGKEGFLVNTGTGCIRPVTLQMEGKNPMSLAEFARGQRIVTGEIFGLEP